MTLKFIHTLFKFYLDFSYIYVSNLLWPYDLGRLSTLSIKQLWVLSIRGGRRQIFSILMIRIRSFKLYINWKNKQLEIIESF